MISNEETGILESFIKSFFHFSGISIDNSEETFDGREKMNLLQKACYFGLNDFAQELLNHGVNPNKITCTESTPPILLAAYNGNRDLIEILVKSRVRLRKV